MLRIPNALFFLLVTAFVFIHPLSSGQQAGADGPRRLISKVTPIYPELARRTNISGTVKLDALVAPDGTVKTTEVVGGNAILIQAAVDAVRKWKFEAAAQQTRERIELKFSPH